MLYQIAQDIKGFGLELERFRPMPQTGIPLVQRKLPEL
jgi:hypothetical protein